MKRYDPATGTRLQRLLFVSLTNPGQKRRLAANVLAFWVILGLAVLAMIVA